jgi:hypothetical protein
MYRRLALFALTAALWTPAPSFAQSAAPTPPALTATEKTFVRAIQTILTKRYPTPAAARKAGYVRFTNEDDTGAISYADKQWNSTSEARPSQLWYDVNGRLLGADYSLLADGRASPPSLFGIDPSRFSEIGAHIHFVVRNPDGSLTYSREVGIKKYAAAGLNPAHPTAAGLVKAGAVDSPDRVATVFLFPHIWDATVWVLPNPNGAFADKNPNVKPSHTPARS